MRDCPYLAWFGIVYFSAMTAYTVYCAAYGPPYRDAYGLIVRAAWLHFAG